MRLAGRIALDGREPTVTDAEGVVRIAVARMVSAIKQISVAKGHDPRDFTLVAYGGAGPMHGAFIAEELEIEQVLVPTGPGNLAALGSLISDVKQDFVRTRTLLPRRLASFAEIANELDRPGRQARVRRVARAGIPPRFNHSQAPVTYGLTECRHAHRNHSSRGCFHPHRMCSDTTAQFQRPNSRAFSTPIGC